MVRKNILFMVISVIFWLCMLIVFYMVVSDNNEDTKELSESAFNSFIDNNEPDTLFISSGKNDLNVVENEIIPESVDLFESSSDMKFSVLNDTLGGKFSSDMGYDFEFGPKGYFCGFFCNNRPYINDGSWSVYEKNGTPVLKIIDNKEKQAVSYNIRMDGDTGYVLYYPSGDFNIHLKGKEKK